MTTQYLKQANVIWHTPAALAWLQTILQERFGHVFALHLHTDSQRIDLRLPGDARGVTLVLDGVTFSRTDSDLPCAQWNAGGEDYVTPIEAMLPAPGAEQLPAPLISATDNGWQIGYDILGLTYWMLNRIEEIGRTDLDNHGRFPATASHAYKHNYLERPVVDEWLYVLGQVMRNTWPEIQLKQHQFSVKVSHDVDRPSRYVFRNWKMIVRSLGGDLLRKDFKNAIKGPFLKVIGNERLPKSDPYNTFDWLMGVSEKNGLRSAFYFICGGNDPHDADYLIEDPRIRQLMRTIHERGHEIGLHPSYGTYQTPGLIKQEADRLRAACEAASIRLASYGGRMHYLRWEHPTTLQEWEDAGMTYDSTLGYADHSGFRCGTCFEYPAFNPKTQRSLKIRIRPLIVMEATVISSNYMGLGSTEKALNKILELKEKCRKAGGCFTLLWHNSEFMNDFMLDIYERVVCK